MRRSPANVEATSRRRVDRAIEATTECIRQKTTHLTQKEKAGVYANLHGRKLAKEIALGDAVIESICDFHVWCTN
jgi:hypothetical protein